MRSSSPPAVKASRDAAPEHPAQRASADGRTSAGSTNRYGQVLSDVTRTHGVRVAAAPKAQANPYAMSAKRARALAEKAGIITKAGNLTPSYK